MINKPAQAKGAPVNTTFVTKKTTKHKVKSLCGTDMLSEKLYTCLSGNWIPIFHLNHLELPQIINICTSQPQIILDDPFCWSAKGYECCIHSIFKIDMFHFFCAKISQIHQGSKRLQENLETRHIGSNKEVASFWVTVHKSVQLMLELCACQCQYGTFLIFCLTTSPFDINLVGWDCTDLLQYIEWRRKRRNRSLEELRQWERSDNVGFTILHIIVNMIGVWFYFFPVVHCTPSKIRTIICWLQILIKILLVTTENSVAHVTAQKDWYLVGTHIILQDEENRISFSIFLETTFMFAGFPDPI